MVMIFRLPGSVYVLEHVNLYYNWEIAFISGIIDW